MSGDSSVNGICGCGLPAHCYQPAVGGGIIYADLRAELSTQLTPQALFTQSSPMPQPLLQAFPFPSTLGEVTLYLLFRPVCFFPHEVGLPLSPVELSSLCHSHKLSCSWLAPLLPPEPLWPAWLVYLQFQEGFPSPNLWLSVCPTLFPYVFIVLIAYYSVSLFSPGGGRSVQGAMLLWPRVVCGSTVVP
jgi:hypothetical protein